MEQIIGKLFCLVIWQTCIGAMKGFDLFLLELLQNQKFTYFQFFHIQFVFTGLLSTCTTALLGRWLIHILGKLNKKKYIIPRHFVSNGVNHHFS
jgi:hypothetical protein